MTLQMPGSLSIPNTTSKLKDGKHLNPQTLFFNNQLHW